MVACCCWISRGDLKNLPNTRGLSRDREGAEGEMGTSVRGRFTAVLRKGTSTSFFSFPKVWLKGVLNRMVKTPRQYG